MHAAASFAADGGRPTRRARPGLRAAARARQHRPRITTLATGHRRCRAAASLRLAPQPERGLTQGFAQRGAAERPARQAGVAVPPHSFLQLARLTAA
jgi:hypothetical protein